MEDVTVSGNQATAIVTAEQPCTLFAALYDKDGKMLEITTINVPSGENQSEPLGLDVKQAGTDQVNVFLTEKGTAKPLCKAESAPIKAEISSDVYAIQSEDGKTLTFYKELPAGASLGDERTWKVEEHYSQTSLPPWIPPNDDGSGMISEVETVLFADDILPVSTACWFYSCENLTSIQDIQQLNTANVTGMRGMFYDCWNLTSLDVSGFNTENATVMASIFSKCSNLTSLDVSGFNTSKVKKARSLFTGCSNLYTIYASSSFVATRLEDSSDMFFNCSNLTGGNGTTYDRHHTDAEYARIDGAGGPGYFTAKT